MKALDIKLAETIDYLKKSWNNPDVGIVGACLVDSIKDVSVFATSTFVEQENKWHHAEFNALQKFRDRFGSPNISSMMIVTLSPCIRETSVSRLGKSCVNVLQDNNISRIYFGALDIKQGEFETYETLGFLVSQSSSKKLLTVCNNLAGLFTSYSQRRGGDINPWPHIKKEIGYSVFQTN